MDERRKFFAVNMFRVCIDELWEDISGRVYSPVCEQQISFEGIGELLLEMDKLFDCIGYPQGFQNKRSFDEEKEENNRYRGIPEPVRQIAEILEQRGKRCTYDIEVVSRRNTSWQGKIYDIRGMELGQYDGEVQLLELLMKLAE